MSIIQVYPNAETYRSIRGIYLDEISLTGSTPFVYANFLASLDGRIAVVENNMLTLPVALTTDHDLRLFLELKTQADCVITHGGYLRARAEGKLGDIFTIGDSPVHHGLAKWRSDHAMPEQPTIIICSNTLDFPMPEDIAPENIIVASSAGGNIQRRDDFEKQGYRVIEAGEQRVTGGELMSHLTTFGFKRIYLCAGPELFESFIADACLHRLYLTTSMQLLGYNEYLTMIPGLKDLQRLRLNLRRLVIDKSQELKHHQLFAAFDCQTQ